MLLLSLYLIRLSRDQKLVLDENADSNMVQTVAPFEGIFLPTTH